MAQPDLNRGGVDLRLSQVPGDLAASQLKDYLRQQVPAFQNIAFDFLVILETCAEDILWRTFEGNPQITNTARVCVPNTQAGVNVGVALINHQINIQHRGQACHLAVGWIQKSETTPNKYRDLRALPYANVAPRGLPNGPLGVVQAVSCGNFNENNQYEVAYTWPHVVGNTFNRISYFGDLWPRRFQVCLSQNQAANPLFWEWMDLHTNIVKGIICDDSVDNTGDRLVYFVLDKSPQFYKRMPNRAQFAVGGGDPALDLPGRAINRNGLIQLDNPPNTFDYRVRFPSNIPQDADLDVCAIPWAIQYSRVYAIRYTPHNLQQTAISVSKLRDTLSSVKRQSIFGLHIPNVVVSQTGANVLADRWRTNLHTIGQKEAPTYQLALLKLLYNCNISATSDGAVQNFDNAVQGLANNGNPITPREQCELLEQSAHDMETSHTRALRRLFALATVDQNHRRLPDNVQPNDVAARLTQPIQAMQAMWISPGFRGMVQRLSSQLKAYQAIVYPSHVEIYGPEAVNINSITEGYRNYIDHFIRVRFSDNNNRPFAQEPLIYPDIIIWDHIWMVLANRSALFPLATQRFQFLGYSVSGLKKRKMVWCFRPDANVQGLSVNSIQNMIGNWDVNDQKNRSLARNSSKWGARMALAFTESMAISLPSGQPTKAARGDVGINPNMPNSDGCGLIDAGLTAAINTTVGRLGYRASQAFQIRFPGVKGVVYTGTPEIITAQPPAQQAPQMLLRNSQVKFNVRAETPNQLRIVSTTGEGQSALFFQSLLKVLEDLADPDNVAAVRNAIGQIYAQTYADLLTPSAGGIGSLQQILRIADDDRQIGMKSRNALLKLAVRLRAANINPNQYQHSFLALYLRELADWARNKNLFAIPIPNSHNVLGLTDDYQVLAPGHVNHPANANNLHPTARVYIRSKGQVVSGPVLVYRDPIIHIGDIQQAQALSAAEMEVLIDAKYGAGTNHAQSVRNQFNRMDNVIIFSQFDSTPFPNRLSGGDLDGDRFEIITIESGFWDNNFVLQAADDYPPPPDPPAAPADWSMDALSAFIGQYIRNDCFDELQNTLMCIADQRTQGMKDQWVKGLAQHISTAVDFAKSGIQADLGAITAYTINSKPDFLRALNQAAFNDGGGEFYQSDKLLGTIYRNVQALAAAQQQFGQIDNVPLAQAIEGVWGNFNTGWNGWANVAQAVTNDLTNWLTGDLGQIQNHRHYLNGRAVPDDSEMEIFMRRPLDDFPDGPIAAITERVLQCLQERQLIEPIGGPAPLNGPLFKNVAGVTLEVVVNVYKKIMSMMWRLALAEANIVRGDYPAGYGQSYAFICLYLLYCQTPPIDRRE